MMKALFLQADRERGQRLELVRWYFQWSSAGELWAISAESQPVVFQHVCAFIGIAMCPWELLKSSNKFTTYLSAYSIFELRDLSFLCVCNALMQRKSHRDELNMDLFMRIAPKLYLKTHAKASYMSKRDASLLWTSEASFYRV